jgi:hypothetical protein
MIDDDVDDDVDDVLWVIRCILPSVIIIYKYPCGVSLNIIYKYLRLILW